MHRKIQNLTFLLRFQNTINDVTILDSHKKFLRGSCRYLFYF